MAIINVELRMMIAERLANDNYRQEILDVRESLRLHLLTYLKTNKIPKMVLDAFESTQISLERLTAFTYSPITLRSICPLNGEAVLFMGKLTYKKIFLLRKKTRSS